MAQQADTKERYILILNQEFYSSIEQLLQAFPFADRIGREGEPKRPLTGRVTSHLDPQWDQDVLAWSTWQLWARQQPDSGLLLIDNDQREIWVARSGTVVADEVDFWRQQRWLCAEHLRAQRHQDILDHYWPANTELREPPRGQP